MLFGKHAIIAIIAISIASISVLLLSNEITRVSDTVVKNRQLVGKLEKRTELFSVISRDVALVGTNEDILERAFIPADNILEFVSALENLAAQNKVTQSYRFSTPVSTSMTTPFPIASIDYQNSMSLTLPSFIKYLKDFEKLPYYTKINSINFSAQSTLGWNSAGSASWSATIYTKASQ